MFQSSLEVGTALQLVIPATHAAFPGGQPPEIPPCSKPDTLERVMNFRRPWRFNSFRVGRSFFQ